MISFSCSHCGMKLKVKPEFAGRSSRCPTCKRPLVVPQPGQAVAIAEGEIDGTSSSLHQAGVEGGVNLERGSGPPAQKPVHELLARRTKKGERYIVEQEIARGGMGAILRAVDCDIRREVAIKYLLDQTDGRKKLCFIEEAQITGQLEHPNIVPIHEVGIDAQKRLFFSMKMVRGRSLTQVLDELRKGPKPAEKEYSLGRLLSIFVAVCNAVAYAHSRGVIHRDLKPGNVMLGDFGEVYVMDWGLARVRDGGAGQPGPQIAGITTSRPSKVETSRQPEADLTQEGAVLGTPVYMPPEQASGHVEAVDQRSDIYSLGAILYEMLALLPPIEKDGGYLEVMMRVVVGQIVPPEQRNPRPARAGKVPKELSAVAMKALAKEPRDRYQSVEALRHDIERFLEGRSVSAKHDSMRELLWKLFKRNSAVSVVTAVAVVLLAILWGRSSYVSSQERRLRQEQSVPAFMEAAHFAVERKKFDTALVQVRTALDYDPERAEALLLKGQLLLVAGKYREAQPELEHYLRLNPKDALAAELAELSRRGRPGDASSAAAIANVFRRQQATTLAVSMVQSREELLAIYRAQINAAWPGLGVNLIMDKDGTCTFSVPPPDRDKVVDLAPLKGVPLRALFIGGCSKVRDLGPLQGAPLTTLNVDGCALIKDLTPLQGMKLTSLNVRGCREIRDLTILQSMPLTYLVLNDCDQIRDLTILEGLKIVSLHLANCRPIKDLAPLKGMPLATLNLGNCAQLQRPGEILRDLPLATLDMTGTQIQDLTFLRGMKLRSLSLSFNGGIKDLSPLRGLELTSLRMVGCGQIQDLMPLQGMPLTLLDLQACSQVRDLAPLKGMKLDYLDLLGSGVRDLTPLQEVSLVELRLTPKQITKGIDALRSLKGLKTIWVGVNPTDRLTAEQFWKKYDAGEFK